MSNVDTIEAVIFDVGGVLVRTLDRGPREAWEKRLGLERGEADSIVFGGEMGTKAQRGEISEEELWRWIGRHLDLSPRHLAAFRRDFWAGDVLDDSLIELIRSLRPRYQTAIISNAFDSLRHDLTERYPIIDAFDLIIVSAEEKVMKPDPEIYKRTLHLLGRSPAEAIFIDDSLPNVEAARNLGMWAVHFGTDTNLAAELRMRRSDEALG
jgi:epoxide hydrolase-like predicted phosphatase